MGQGCGHFAGDLPGPLLVSDEVLVDDGYPARDDGLASLA